MAPLSSSSQERLFVLGLGFAACAVISLMRRMLIHYRDDAIEPPPSNKPQYITQEVEDSLKLSTLDKLLDSPNFAIQETAAIIVCERALHDGTTINVLLWYITRPDYELREQGIRALSMMMNNTTIELLNEPKIYAALVKCLEYCVKDYPHEPFSPTWDNWTLRDIVEQIALLLLSQLTTKYGATGLIRSRFVPRWLAHEPYGTNQEETIENFVHALDPSYRLSEMLFPLFTNPAGRKQLIEAGLLPEGFQLEDPHKDKKDVRMKNGEGTAGEIIAEMAAAEEDFENMFPESTRRWRDQTSEARHRHREAMVLNDGTRPLGRGDIFQRER